MPSRSPDRSLWVGLFLLALAAAITLLAIDPGVAVAQSVFDFVPPHRLRAPVALLDPAARRRVANAIAGAHPGNVGELIAVSLAQSGGALHFGLSHATRLRFGTTEREGNCVEYANLFGAVFNRAASGVGLRARAWVVRSDARFLGQRLPWRATRDHDWVLVVDPAEGRRWYVDPTLADAGLSWDIATRIQGDVGRPLGVTAAVPGQ